MDINSALARMRELSVMARQGHDVSDEMSIVFDAIDGWLSAGGFRPDAWAWAETTKN